MSDTVMTAVEAGRTLPELLAELPQRGGAYYITDAEGRAQAVLLDIDRYNAMMDALEEDAGNKADAKIAGELLEAILKRKL